MDAFCTVNEIAKRWNLSTRRVQKYCAQGRIQGVQKLGRSWMIPQDAKRPLDQREKQNSNSDGKQGNQNLPEEGNDFEPAETSNLDYRQVLQIDFRGKRYERIMGKSYVQLATEILWECPLEIKAENPQSMLRLTWGLADGRYRDVYMQLLKECEIIIEDYECSQIEKEQMKGEYEFLKAFLYYPDFNKMIPGLQRSVSFCQRPLRCVESSASLTFGGYSPWCVFRMEQECLESEMSNLTEALFYIKKLGKGLGAGLDTLFRAETLFFRGEIDQAEILAYEAMYEAETNGQDSVCLGAYSVLAHMAIHKGKQELWRSMIDKIHVLRRLTTRHGERNRRMADLIEGELLNAAGHSNKIAEWIKDDMGVMHEMPEPMLELAAYVHISYLYHNKMYARSLGVIRSVLLTNTYGLLGMRPFIQLFGGACEVALGNRENGRNYFLQMAKSQDPSDVVLVYGEFRWILGGIVEEYVQDNAEIICKINRICDPYAKGWQKMRAFLASISLPQNLTRREYEVAWEAAQGHSNAKIAENLGIEVNTVRGHMRQIFDKLKIRKRSELKNILDTK